MFTVYEFNAFVQPFVNITHRKRNIHIEMDRLYEPSC